MYPPAYVQAQTGNDAWRSRTECLVQGGSAARLSIRVRFLHLILTEAEDQPWQGAMEREIQLGPLHWPEVCDLPVRHPFLFSPEGQQERLEGMVVVTARHLIDGVFRVSVGG